jgi:hypothetical protein
MECNNTINIPPHNIHNNPDSNIERSTVCYNAYQHHKIPELIQYLHAAAFSPVPSTCIAAIQRGFFQSWPGLTATAVQKHLPKSEATTKGHMDQTRKNLRSTKTMDNSNLEEEQEPNSPQTHQIFAAIENTDKIYTGKIYTDQTGHFPVTSSQGNKYVLVLYEYDTNAILTEALHNRTATKILRAYKKLVKYLHNQGFRPKIHWLDNEASDELEQFNNSNQIELVPPHMHRRNAAERAIWTWKNHFVAGLCSTNTRFPMHLWDRLLAQASITLNLICPSRRNPKISAYNMLEGTFDYNKPPLTPPGTKVNSRETATTQKHGIHMEPKDGISAQQWSITDAIGSSRTKPKRNASRTQSNSFRNILRYRT